MSEGSAGPQRVRQHNGRRNQKVHFKFNPDFLFQAISKPGVWRRIVFQGTGGRITLFSTSYLKCFATEWFSRSLDLFWNLDFSKFRACFFLRESRLSIFTRLVWSSSKRVKSKIWIWKFSSAQDIGTPNAGQEKIDLWFLPVFGRPEHRTPNMKKFWFVFLPVLRRLED